MTKSLEDILECIDPWNPDCHVDRTGNQYQGRTLVEIRQHLLATIPELDRIHTVHPDYHAPHLPRTPFKHADNLYKGNHEHEAFLPLRYRDTWTWSVGAHR